jgi:ATP-dependent DNA helicase RecQ
MSSLAESRRVLRETWGFPDFRHHQRRAVLAALRGRDCLAVLPTGGGKSLCYQVPALTLPGLTLVVSPLISLMQDQVTALRNRGVAAAYLSSTQQPRVRSAVLESLGAGRLKLLYAAPERLGSLVSLLARRGVALLAVDEAHCISEWGHDFRPHYRSIGRYRVALGRPPVTALTATATPQTLGDITRVLGLKRPVRIAQSFDRPNLRFSARRFGDNSAPLRVLVGLLRAATGSAIAYVPTRNQADGVAAVLREWGFAALPYHAALPAASRRGLLARFLDGRTRVMVATNAFGMGIDKPDVRLVAHMGVPPRPEAYFQEAGRAGRDGLPARCVMLWSKGDLMLAAKLAGVDRAASPAQREARRRALATMRRYVHTRGCRRRVLLSYLGERLARCSGCDGCGPGIRRDRVGVSQNASGRAEKRSQGVAD